MNHFQNGNSCRETRRAEARELLLQMCDATMLDILQRHRAAMYRMDDEELQEHYQHIQGVLDVLKDILRDPNLGGEA
jgi:hypothetical protein